MSIGEIFLDKYRVDAFLGHGGMGVVALCTHLALNEQVAIKMLRRDVLDDAEAVERFLREARAAAKLKSEYVARVSDSGRSHDNVPYMVMEYLDGKDLGDLLDEQGNLGLFWAIELTLQSCEALAEAHSLGIVHRDIKPTNLFVTWRPDGSTMIKVLDFGISKALEKSSSYLVGEARPLTETQSLLGTPAYMSPEQMRSARTVDARTDIWSLGTVLYEMLEGRRPFEAESFSEMCVKVAVDPPGRMTNTPLALQQVVLRCLEKAQEQRYQSMADLARDLVPFAQDPHHAQVLVERMSRTLSRGPVSGVSGPMRAPHSAERAAEAAPGNSVDAAAPDAAIPAPIPNPSTESGTAPPAPAPVQRTEARQSFSTTMAVGTRRRRGTLIIAGLAATAAALGAVISLARSPVPAPEHAGDRGKGSGAPPESGSTTPHSASPSAIAPVAGPVGPTEPTPPANRGLTEAAAPANRGSAADPAPGVAKGDAKGAHSSQPAKPGAAARHVRSPQSTDDGCGVGSGSNGFSECSDPTAQKRPGR